MKDLPLTWRQFLRILVEGIASDGKSADPACADALAILNGKDGAAKDPWSPVLTALGKLKGYNLGSIRGLRTLIGDETTLDDDLSQQSPEKRLFFLVEYRRGEIITQSGTYSDYVALHHQGNIRVWPNAPRTETGKAKSCWDAPHVPNSVVPRTFLGKALNRLFSFAGHEKILPTAPHESAAEAIRTGTDLPGVPRSLWTDGEGPSPPRKRDFGDRLMGVTSVVWKQPRTATLIADGEEHSPCQMALVKRIFLLDCLFFMDKKRTQPTQFYLRKVDDFLKDSLHPLLAQNRLFRALFYVEEVENWEALLHGLAPGNDRPVAPALRRIREGLPPKVRQSLGGLEVARLDDAARYRVVSELNDFLDRPDLYDAKAWPWGSLPPEEQGLLQKGPKERTVVETYRLNRLLIEAALPGVFRSVRELRPHTLTDFKELVEQIRLNSSVVPTPLRPREGDVLFEGGDSADGLYLILEGRVRLNLGSPNNRIPLNHLVENGFFGENCVQEDSPSHLYQAEALTNCNLLKIERRAVLALAESFPDFKQKLLREAARMRRRAEQVMQGHRLPPADLPAAPDLLAATTAKLMRATNLLVIDMDRCTRCDQCVQACTESHQGHPRFHRANPDFRIGRWEIAGACVHCSDAPCLEDCPVGAIALLENGSVQVLRDRCISCRKCERACPFGVIEYHPPVGAADGASANKDDYVVSHKCDLCLTPERDPPCVVACPYGAAKRGSPSVFFPGLKSMARFTDPL